MSYTEEIWKNRIYGRIDICASVTHLTRESFNDWKKLDPLETLIKILGERKIIGSSAESGFIVGNRKAVCFQETPPYSICENIDFENIIGRKKYTPYGLMLPKSYVYKKGGRPVIYDNKDEAKFYLNQSEWWRIVNFDLTNSNNIIDWTHEREWRFPGDFDFDIEQVTVLVPNAGEYKRFYALWNEYQRWSDVAQEVDSVLNLGAFYG